MSIRILAFLTGIFLIATWIKKHFINANWAIHTFTSSFIFCFSFAEKSKIVCLLFGDPFVEAAKKVLFTDRINPPTVDERAHFRSYLFGHNLSESLFRVLLFNCNFGLDFVSLRQLLGKSNQLIIHNKVAQCLKALRMQLFRRWARSVPRIACWFASHVLTVTVYLDAVRAYRWRPDIYRAQKVN